MEIYKIASKQKYRFETSSGSLTVEQLWSLDLNQLDELAIKLNSELEAGSGKKSFINKRTPSNTVVKNKLEIVVDIINTKQADNTKKESLAAKKQRNQKIMELIEEKSDQALAKKSITQLKALLTEEEELEEEEA